MCGRASRVVVLPLAGLPSGARLDQVAAELAALGRSNSPRHPLGCAKGQPDRASAPRHHPGARPHSASAPFRLAGGVRRWVVRGLSLKLLVLPAQSVLLRRRSRASVPEIKQQDQAGVGRVGGA